MSCAEVRDRLDAWIDGDLEPAEAGVLEVHMECCAACDEERRLADEIRAELRGLPELDPPDRVIKVVRDETARSVGERVRQLMDSVTLRPAPAVAVLAVGVVLMLTVLPMRRSGTPQYTDQEVARAAEETMLALAYVSSVTRRAESQVRRKIFDDGAVAATVHGISRSLEWTGSLAGAEPTTNVLPEKNYEGSS
jgi:anti-sigma factor RsiW